MHPSSQYNTNSISLNYIKQNRLKDTSWFSGVFANTAALTPTSCIPLESFAHGGCFYVPFIGTGEAVRDSLVALYYGEIRLSVRFLSGNAHTLRRSSKLLICLVIRVFANLSLSTFSATSMAMI